MGQDLPVGQRAIDRRAHRAEIFLSHFRMNRGTGQFAVRQVDVVPCGGDGHALEEFSADLMPEPARAAMDAQNHVAFA